MFIWITTRNATDAKRGERGVAEDVPGDIRGREEQRGTPELNVNQQELQCQRKGGAGKNHFLISCGQRQSPIQGSFCLSNSFQLLPSYVTWVK